MTRLERVLNEMKKRNLHQILVSDPASIWYLTGIANEPYERLWVLYISDKCKPILFANRLFNIPSPEEKPDLPKVVWHTDSDDAVQMIADRIEKTGKIGIDKTWPAGFLIPLLEKCPDLTPVLSSDCLDDCRAVKDEEEIRKMKEASRINDLVNRRARDYVKVGMTEKQVAEFIDKEYVKEGAQGPSFTTIVSFGANAADPHHEPDDTVLKEGQCVLFDMGCRKDRYCSDMTRTFFAGQPTEEEAKVHDLVRSANEKAESLIRPGVKICDLDKAARDMITEAGYGPYFNHRLGHFIGQTDHEKGDVSSVNQKTCQPGMIFSIEPGVYLPGRFGVRVEDLVLVTEDGCEVLNHEDKHWKVVG
ncbi:MAG: Xaa-Pro peptidase family protein [Lachnospiraceae bacterium]|nr:Xaa-Pro peptidase family protein [Lachnospiraceae bacterium]